MIRATQSKPWIGPEAAASRSGTGAPADDSQMRQSPAVGRGYGRLLEVLELMAARKDPITVSQLARELDIPKATTNLLMQHLVARRYINVSARRTLTIGPQFLRLGLMIAERSTARSSARQVLQEIGHASGLDTYLGMITEHDVIYVDKVEGRESVRVDVRLGIGRPLHCTAVGKAALAFGPQELWNEINADTLVRHTDRTIVTEAELRADIERWRECGYVIVEGEIYEGHMSIAVPIHDENGVQRILVALGHRSALAGRTSEIVQMLQRGAQQVATDSDSVIGSHV
jgi:DNA-binding IclR family transcriptional regulator